MIASENMNILMLLWKLVLNVNILIYEYIHVVINVSITF